MSAALFCRECSRSFPNEDTNLCDDCENRFNKLIKKYLKKNLEVHVELDNGQSLGYIEVKVLVSLEGKTIYSGYDSTWINVTD